MASKWVEIRKSGDYVSMGNILSINPAIVRILNNRGIPFEKMGCFLNAELSDLLSPHLLAGVDLLCEKLKEKIDHKKRIRIIGDYDIDGVFSAYILYESIKRVGGDVDVVLPHRIKDGYGMNISMIKKAYDDGVDTIITCDNGISAKNECALAKELGITVLITDHHEIPFYYEGNNKVFDLPDAHSIVDPKLMEEDYYHNLCGAGVCYKISQVLYELYHIDDMQQFIEFAAFATIGDVMPLIGENRIIVKHGLKAMENTTNPGLSALIKACEIDNSKISPYHIGFVLGPCINAAGRLDDAMDAFSLLCADKNNAMQKAMALKGMNENRKIMTEEAYNNALNLIDTDNIPNVIVLLLEDVHESILGIIAGKIKEEFYRPAIVLTNTDDGVKGSCRSIDAYNIFEHLSECKEYFTKFGGHAAAAGLSMSSDTESPVEMTNKLSAFLNSHDGLKDEDFDKRIEIDMVMPFSYIDENLIYDLDKLEPLGTGMKKPVFATKDVLMHSGRILGTNRRTFKCTACDSSGKNIDALYFGEEENVQKISDLCLNGDKISVLYYPQINEFRGARTLQVVIQDFR